MNKLDFEIGLINRLKIFEIDKKRVLLKRDSKGKGIYLDYRELPKDRQIGDSLDVFIYRDFNNKLVATLKEPYGQVGQLAYLRLVDKTKIGGFLDWGLEKDLFLPIREQTCKLEKGKYYLVRIYLDKSKRLCASMNIADHLKNHPAYKPGQSVEGIVYDYNPKLGIFVALDRQYYGLVHLKEKFVDLKIGDKFEFRVIKIRDDGRVDLSTRQVAHKQMDLDAQAILKFLVVRKGFLPLNDKSHPEEIKNYLSISKNAFKRALGKLLKEGKVKQTRDGIKLLVDIKIEDLDND